MHLKIGRIDNEKLRRPSFNLVEALFEGHLQAALLTHKLLTYGYYSAVTLLYHATYYYYFCQNYLSMTSQEDFPTSRSVYFPPACRLLELCNGFCVRAGLDYGQRSALVSQEFQLKTRSFEATAGMADKMVNDNNHNKCLKVEWCGSQVSCLRGLRLAEKLDLQRNSSSKKMLAYWQPMSFSFMLGVLRWRGLDRSVNPSW